MQGGWFIILQVNKGEKASEYEIIFPLAVSVCPLGPRGKFCAGGAFINSLLTLLKQDPPPTCLTLPPPSTPLSPPLAHIWGEIMSQTCGIGSNAWRRKGLGNAWVVWNALAERVWPSARQLALALGLSPDTAERHLKKLAAYELAVKSKEGWTRGPADLEVVADGLPSAGASDCQQRVHDWERVKRWQPAQRSAEPATAVRQAAAWRRKP